jgi:hypothetical protein
MADDALAPLVRSVEARKAGRMPSPSDLAACQKARWKPGIDLSCWNGRRPGFERCGFAGSQNIPVFGMTGLADWPWLAALARHWKAEGLFGLELGSDAQFYSGGIIDCMVLAMRELARAESGRLGDEESIRQAIRAYLAWSALAAVPVSRVRDELVTPAGVEKGTRKVGKKDRLPGLAVAPAGNRYTAHRRGAGLTSDDSGSATLAAALVNPGVFGLTDAERNLLAWVVRGGSPRGEALKAAAKEVAAWLFGTIDQPARRWRWTLRRTTEGAGRVFWGLSPNPYKAARAVGQVTSDGTYWGLQPTVKAERAWSEGWTVTEEAGVYVASCKSGTASLPKLGGDVLWEVEIEGSEVRFS